MVEKFNAEAARNAVVAATNEIETAVTNFKRTSEEVYAQLSSTGSAMGGNVGAAALASFENESKVAFDNLKANLNSFMSRVDTIVKNDEAVTSETEGIYGN